MSTPVITVRQLGSLPYTSVNTVAISVIANVGILIGLQVRSLGQMKVLQSLTIDSQPNQEVVQVQSIDGPNSSFTALFTRQHLTLGFPVVASTPSTYEPLYGNGVQNFISDLAAVAQIIQTRLRLFEGEWWAAQNDGLPLWQDILGQSGGPRNQQQIELVITSRIKGTPYVQGVSNVKVNYNVSIRSLTYYAEVQTQFGVVVATNIPTVPSQALPS